MSGNRIVNNGLLTDETSNFVGKEVFYLALKRKKAGNTRN
jgi:hypothetical protein